MAVYEITPDRIQPLAQTTFGAAGIRERGDLQRLLRAQIEIIAPDVLVVAEEFGEWEDSRRRIDLLAVDRDANLVVIELKRTDDGGHMDLQAIRYAAMVSTMTFDRVVSIYADHLVAIGRTGNAREEILRFLDWDEPLAELFAQRVRIVLAAADFSVELTTAVMWLNDQGLDLRCVRLAPYRDGNRTLIDVQQVIPLPEAATYMVKIKEKEASERAAAVVRNSERGELFNRFWTTLKERASLQTNILKTIKPKSHRRFSGRHNAPGMNFAYHIDPDETARVECWIFGCSGADAKAIFDNLHRDRGSIEGAFGEPIVWDRLDEGIACRISYELPNTSFSEDDSQWPALQEQMIRTMIAFERSMRPSIDRLQL